MKKLLSMILAAAMLISLVPAVFAADATAEEYIRYSISAASLSTASFVGEHPIHMNESGQLINTTKSLKVGEEIVQTTAEPTYRNVIKFLQGSEITGTSGSSWANSELSLISYRPLDYYNYRVVSPRSETAVGANDWTSVRKFTNRTDILFDSALEKSSGLETDNTGAPKIYTMPSALTSSTAPFEMYGKNDSGMSHSFLADGFYYATFNLGTNTAPTFEKNRGTINESFFPIRIKIPETAAAGKYQIRVGNTYKSITTANTYGDLNASECELYMTKIDSSGIEANFKYSNGSLVGLVDTNGNDLSRDAYAAAGNKLTGTYKSLGNHSDTFEDVLTLAPGEEYFLYFRIAEGVLTDETIKKESAVTDNLGKVYLSGSTCYQNFKISYIDLIPVAEDVPVVLKSATISYDKATKTASVASAKMSDGTDATGYTVSYGMTGATSATINAATGVVTSGTADETVSVYADVTLDGTTVRTPAIQIPVYASLGTSLKYRISPNFINDAALEIIVNSDADVKSNDIRNSELLLVSWKDVYYTKPSSSNGIYVINKATAETTDLAPITNALIPDTSKYELPGRIPNDLVPKLVEQGYITQILSKRFDTDGKEAANTYTEKSNSRPHFAIKLYIPKKGAYKLSLGNNFGLADVSAYGGANYITNNSGVYTSLGNEAMTEVYFAKADFDLTTTKSGSAFIPTANEAAVFTTDNKIGWYDSGLYGETQEYEDNYVIAPEAGEYYLIFNTCKESLERNKNVYHRSYSSGNYSYQDFQLFILSEIELTPVSDDAEYSKAFDAAEETYITSGSSTVNAYAYTDAQEEISLGNTVALGNNFSVSAPEKEGYSFLYWAKGLGDKKQVISYSKNLTYKPNEGANYVIAVYAKDGEAETRAEFYNANGSLIATLTADGKAPKLPSMAGFGVASGWQLYGSDEVFSAEADITVSGNMVFVAKYDEKPGKVKVNDVEYTYGDTVTMPALDSSRIFKGWKRNGELVSADKNYTFKAWEDATVEAVYADATPAFSGKFMKIVIDSFAAGNETAVMAEFIGLEDAIEKGIIIGNKKVAMKSGDKQFTILADVAGKYIGYAILRDGNGFTEVTDGSAEVE